MAPRQGASPLACAFSSSTTSTRRWAGAAVSPRATSRWSSPSGMRSTFLTSVGPDLAPQEVCDGVTIFRAPVLGRTKRSTASILSMVSFWPIGIRHGRQVTAGRSYDVVNSWFAVPSGPTGIHLARHFGSPHVLTMAGGDIYDPSKWYTPDKNPILGAAVRRVLAGSDAHVAVSNDLARRARSIYGFDGPIDVISLGAAAPRSRPADRARNWGSTPDAIYIVAVGRLVRRKNLALADHGARPARARRRASAGGRRRARSSRPRGAGAERWASASSVQFRGFVAGGDQVPAAGCSRHVRAALAARGVRPRLPRGHALRPARDRRAARRPGRLSRGWPARVSSCRRDDRRCAAARRFDRLVADREPAGSDERRTTGSWRSGSASPPPPPSTRRLFASVDAGDAGAGACAAA